MNKHEMLYGLYRQKEALSDELWHRLTYPPLFSFRKFDKKATALAKEAQEVAQRFSFLFYEVLSSHGISKDDINGEADARRFQVLLDRRLHEMTVKPVGNRLVFFIDGIALKENEKAASLRMKMRMLVG